MKHIQLTDKEKEDLFLKFFNKFKKELDDYIFNVTDKTITVKTDVSEVAKEKVNIIFTQDAYLKMQALVEFFDTEVGWYGLVDKIDDKNYKVYDVKVCKQYVDGAKVDTEDDDTLEFFESLTDDEAEHLHFQAHSHVNMSTSASAVDTQNQYDVIKNIGMKGFYIFQIWNKKNEISTYLYDLDNNIFYDTKDVLIEVEGVDDFILQVKPLVCKRVYQWNNCGQWQNQWEANGTKKGKKKKEDSYSEYYYGYGGYYE